MASGKAKPTVSVMIWVLGTKKFYEWLGDSWSTILPITG